LEVVKLATKSHRFVFVVQVPPLTNRCRIQYILQLNSNEVDCCGHTVSRISRIPEHVICALNALRNTVSG